MILHMSIAAVVILMCVAFHKMSRKLGIPALLAFTLVGMLFGSDGIFKISFDNYEITEQICTVALVFIMFYGGAGIRISQAKKVAVRASLLSTVGVVLTAGFVGLFCHYILKIKLLESFLIGAVISSTDAASMFSILRSKKLNLKHATAPLLEMESGSNDPFAYMLTIVILSIMSGDNTGVGKTAYMLFAQIIFGVAFGVIIAYVAMLLLKKIDFSSDGFDSVLVVGVVLSCYAFVSGIGGNGYLSVYIAGIILGNTEIKNRRSLIHFFDGVTGLMQMMLFFFLGLLSFPSQFEYIALPALAIALFLTFIARPLAVFMILSPFKAPLKQQALVSFAGMRGAASIVFAILTVVSPAYTHNDVFHIVFFIVLFSILFQGTLLPFVAKKLDMTDDGDVMKTFTDYTYELPVSFIKFELKEGHYFVDKKISEINFPPNVMVTLIVRDGKRIVPDGNTALLSGDTVCIGGASGEKIEQVSLVERDILSDDVWAGKRLCDVSNGDELVIMIKREGEVVIPNGNTVIKDGDVLICNKKTDE